MRRSTPYAGLLLGLALATIAAGGCSGSAPTPGPPEFPLVACRLDEPGAPTAPPGYTVVPRGEIVFTMDSWHNLSPVDRHCGAQAVRGASASFTISALGGEDRIMWVATLARPQPAAPDPVPPTVSFFRLGVSRPVSTQLADNGTTEEQYRMLGNFGHDAEVGLYLVRITSGTGLLLAEGSFEIVP